MVSRYDGSQDSFIRVLLVDDEPGFLDLAKNFLEGDGSSLVVETAPSAEDGVDLLEEYSFDVVVSDYQMPGMDGLDFLDCIRNRMSMDIPFIMFTGRGREEVAMKALNLGANRYLQKGGAPKSQYDVLARAVKQEYRSYTTEKELKKSEREKKLILESTTDLIAYLNPSLDILWVNKAAGDSVGKKPSELEGKKCFEIWHDRDTPCSDCPVTKALETGDTHKGEVKSPDGRHWLVSGNPVHNDQGEVIGVVEATQEITKLKNAMEKLEKTTEEYRSILDAMNESVWIIDSSGRFIEVNETAAVKLGYSRDELLDMGPSDLDGVLSKSEVKEKIGQIFDVGFDVFETKHRTKDGEWIPVEVSNSLITYQDSEAVLSVARDISKRKRTQKKLKERVKELNLLYKLSKLEDKTSSISSLLEKSVKLLPPALKYPDKAIAKIVYRDMEYKSTGYEQSDYCLNYSISVFGEKEGYVKVGYIDELPSGNHVFIDEEIQVLDEFTNRIGSILEKKIAKKNLKKSEERYRRLFETAQDGMLILDSSSGEINDANPYIQELLNYNKQELVGKKLWEIGREQDIDENKKRFQKLVDEGYIRYEDLPLETKNSNTVYVEFVSNTYIVGEKKVVQCNIRDITERKQVEEKFRSFVENAPDGIIVHDLNGKIILANQMASNLLGYTKKELIGMEIPDIDPLAYKELPLNVFWKEVGSGESKSIESRHKRKDGETYPVRVSLKKISVDGMPAIIAFFRDITEIKKAQKTVEKNEKQLKKSQEIAKVGSWELDISTGKLDWSEETHRIFGTEFEKDLEYRDFLKTVHPEDQDYVDNAWKKAVQTGDYDVEHRIVVDGEVKWVHQKASITRVDGEPVSAFGTVQDITERKKLEERLKEYKRAIEGSTDLMAAVDVNKEFIFANKKYQQFFGIDNSKKLVGKKLKDIYSGSELETINKNINDALNGETVKYTMKRGKNPERHFDIRYYPLKEKDKVRGVVGVLRDITERKKIEKDLKTKDKAIQASKNAISIINSSGRYTHVNPAWTKLFGYTLDEVVGKKQTEISSDTKTKQTKQKILEKVKKHGEWTEETKIKTDKNTKSDKIHVEISSSKIETDDTTIGYINIYKDITSRKKSEERREFLHTLLRHDVKNKIQLIQGYHDLITEQKLPEQTENYLKKSNQAVRDSLDIIEKIKIMQKLEEKTEIQEIDINKTIKKVIEKEEPHAQQKNINIIHKKGCQKVLGGTLLNELFSNIIENSIRHAECNVILIKTIEDKNKCQIVIEDDGQGLPRQTKKIFNKGFKKGENAGSGLGLYFAKTITNRYNGEISAEQSEKGGAKIKIELQKPKTQQPNK
ncbi:Signal transduction histidine kinase containing several PAS domain and REC domain [Methanonatronarchaeum thermophilum]|uniref:histidine kinase n=1 Tax=Methanonatronarchaeum thermophilum TaxID=1927129 RepID=A0A1Y3GDN8_9EURY|nr:PAS domain S-box protein [Methanonatronarchaeum thermophilum]OUJ19548.1 Signal transduction histidine kinase containing several PAS domain and REC domain [Methanonatronarchaeum thermophilum]